MVTSSTSVDIEKQVSEGTITSSLSYEPIIIRGSHGERLWSVIEDDPVAIAMCRSQLNVSTY